MTVDTCRLQTFGSYAADDLFSNMQIEAPAEVTRKLTPLVVAVAIADALTGCAASYTLYTYLERPVRRMARAIAFSGHWGY